MAGSRLEQIIVIWRVGGLALTVPVIAVLAVAVPRFTANKAVGCVSAASSPYLYILVAWEWTVACFTVGTACAAIAANLFALKHHYCDPRAACGLYLIAATAAFAVGSLAAASALGIVWIHGSRFRPAQAP